jgi:uncharacterized protein YkwD
MRRFRFVKLAAFLFAIIVCLSLTAPAAFAANETDTAASTPSAAAATEATAAPEVDPVAQYKAEVIRLVNIEREKVGAPALKSMDALYPMADVRAKESAASFSHTRPNGTRCFTIFSENSMKYRAAGENLAYGFSTPASVVTAWMNSEGHKRNLLDPDFKYIGIGYYVNESGRVYCSQLFYTPKNAK